MGLVKRWSAGCVIAAVASGALGAYALAGETGSGRSRTVPKITARAVSESALAKDLIYACGPEAKDLVAYLQDVAHLSPRAARSSVAGLAQGKAGLFKIYRRSNDFADQDADRWIERYDAAEDKRRWAYDVCVARRFSRQLHGAPLLTRLP